MKASKHILAVFGLPLFLAVGLLWFCPGQSQGQVLPSWMGSDQIWDWSDFRMNTGFRLFIPKLISGSVHVAEVKEQDGTTTKWHQEQYDMLGGGNFSDLPQSDFFKEGWFIVYVDRLALRAHFEEDHSFRGVAHFNFDVYTQTDPPTRDVVSELQLGWTRFGLDLDIIRYPFIRAGINFDRNYESVIYLDRHGRRIVDRNGTRVLQALKFTTRQPPVTIGVHAFVSPGRVFGIPITVQARGRFPFPLLTKIVSTEAETRITEWEACIGLRPNIWNTSRYAHNTFALGIDAGFKSTYLDMDPGDGTWNVKAHWQGPYVQFGLYY